MQSGVSSVTPDYASTIASVHDEQDKVPAEKPRAGKLKTVGDPSLPTIDLRSGGSSKFDTYNKEITQQADPIPSIDFGPTFTYKPTSRPGSSGTPLDDVGEKPHSRSRSADRLRESPGHPTKRTSPAENNRHSYFGGRTTPSGLDRADPPSTQRHSVAWTPTAGVSPGSGGAHHRSLTPEQWVQFRAALAAQPEPAPPRRPTPTIAHQRQGSSPSPGAPQQRRSTARTPPPFVRNASGDWTTPPSRPASRGAGAYLNPSPGWTTPDGSAPNLSAKEQMHVSRATGTPLINLTNNKPPAEQPSSLIGALAAREREKEAIKEGIRTNSVQQAIYARQHQQAQQQQAEMELAMQQQQQRYSQLMAYQNAAMAQNGQAQVQPQPGMPERRMSWGPSQRLSMLSMSQGTMGGGYEPGMTQSGRQYPASVHGFPPPQRASTVYGDAYAGLDRPRPFSGDWTQGQR